MSRDTSNASFVPPRWSWRHVPWIGGLFIAVIVAMAAYDVYRSHQTVVSETTRELDSQARVIAEQTARSLQTVDRVLGHIVDEYRRGVISTKAPEELHAYLRDQAVGLVQIEGVSLVDAHGNVHATSSVFPMPESMPNIATLPLFQAMATQRQPGMVVDKASPAVVRKGPWVFRMVRRLENPSGDFAGIVAAGGKVEYFQQFYRDVRLDAGTHITLMHRDGTLIARHPAVEAALGQRFPALDAMLAARQAGLVTPSRATSPIDGVDRFVAIERLPDHPLAVIVTRDAAVALAPWRQQAVGTAVRTLALGVLALFLLGMVRRQFVRLDKVRESLEISRERFALAAAGSDDGIWDWDVIGDRVFASARAREIFGLPSGPDVLSRDAWFAEIQIHPDDVAGRRNAIEAHLAGRSAAYAGEYRVRDPNGEYRWVRVRGLCVRDSAGNPTRMAGSVSDIDSRRRAEDALRLSEERYALAMTGSTGGHWVWEVATDALFVSGTLNQLFGLPADTQPVTRVAYFARIAVHPDDLFKIRQINDEVLGGRASRLDFEYRIVLPGSGDVRWILSRAQCFRDAEGHAVRVAGVSVDISERKRTEQALRLSEERFALAVAGSNDGIVDWDVVGDRMYTSERAMEMLGVDSKLTVRTRAEWLDLFKLHPGDRQRHADELRKFLDSDATLRAGEYRVRRADGEYRWVRLRNLCVRDAAGRPLRLAGSVSDIDAYKRVEAALRESEERYALAMTGSNEGHWVWDMPGRQIFVSAKLAELFALPGGAQVMADQAYFDRIPLHPDDRERVHRNRADHVAGLTPRLDHEFRVVLPDSGEVRWIHTRAQCFRDADGRPLRLAGSTVDATQRKRAEEALRLSEERFALAVAGSDSGVWDINYGTRAVFYSRRGREIAGLPLEPEVQPLDDWEASLRLHPDDVALRNKALNDHLAGTAPAYVGEWRMLQPDGSYRWVRVHGMSVRDAAGAPLRMTGSVTDIDARRRAEDSLRQSEERFALAVAGSDDGVWDFDYTTRMVFNSRRGRQITGMPLEPEVQPMDEWFQTLQLHPEDAPRRLEAMEAHLTGRAPAYVGEWRIRQRDGSYRWVRVHGTCTRDAQGKPLRMAGSVTDIDARKRAEESLRQSEERYALAVAGSDDGVWDWDFAAGLAFESARARELQGLPPGPELQPLNTLLESLRVHPDDEPRRADGIRAHLAGETVAYECEYRVRHDDGVYRWIRVRALCIRDAEGKPCRMAGSVSDIDARRRAEEGLRQSEERFSLAVAGAQDGILDWDITADSMYVSERAMRLVGLTLPSGVFKVADWSALVMPRFHPDDAPRVSRELHGDPQNPADSHEGEYRILGADGLYRWVRFRGRSVRNAAGRAIRWAGSVSDVDGLKRTEEALRRSEERYALAVAGSNEGLWDWDLRSDSLFLSPRAQEILWLTPGEPQRPRREWIELTHYHPEDRERVRGAISAHLRDDTPHYRVEYRLRHHSGEWRWYRQRGVAVRDAQGRPTRMAGSMEDITDRKTAEGERERLEGQLRQAQKLEAIGTLAGGIAHDFNNILAAILGYGEMAQRDAAEGTPLRRHIDAAISAGMRAKSLVERILAFSRSGMAERVPVHVESVVGEALDLVAASLPAGVVLERSLAAGDAAILGDATQVHQVVMNLCANAVQAIRSQGTLTVTLDLMGVGGSRCTTSVLADTHHIRLRVSDTGAGIAPQVLERIFDPFFTTKEVGVGTGLGLSLVHGIVTDLGGGIDVESQVGVGSTFTVYLPWQSCVAVPAVAPEAAAPNGNGETILLVDDEEPLVRLGEEMIAELGYEPVGFTSSLLALETFRAEPHRFHAVLSDEAMPEMTGSELVREILKIRPDIPVVMMSGYVTLALAARAREAGVTEVLSKPLVSRDIARGLASALQR